MEGLRRASRLRVGDPDGDEVIGGATLT